MQLVPRRKRLDKLRVACCAWLIDPGKCDNVWSICMVEGSTSNGTLTVGGVDHRLHTDNISYVPDSGLGFHSVKVAALNIGDNSSATASIQVGQSAILDTGTNVLLLPSHVRSKSAPTGDATRGWILTCGWILPIVVDVADLSH